MHATACINHQTFASNQVVEQSHRLAYLAYSQYCCTLCYLKTWTKIGNTVANFDANFDDANFDGGAY